MASNSTSPGLPAGPGLVVEDDPLLADDVAEILRGAGLDPVEICSTTEAAREALARLSPAVVVLDVRLGDRDDGWAFAELLPLLAPHQPRLVFATGAPESIPPEVAALGAVLSKPYAPADLLAALGADRGTGLFGRLRGALGG